ncbi:MAG TPA: response regulator [Alphaproteobacteria bacterium]|nr:response regulator [Alphaproteobacteria bacterium]
MPLRKILHVDDDHVMRMMTRTALTRSPQGFEIESCLSGKEALEKISGFSPDLLLVDMIMPIMDGPAFVHAVRQLDDPLRSKTPVVFITGKDEIHIRDRDILEPVLGIIHKPFSASQLGNDLAALWNGYKK